MGTVEHRKLCARRRNSDNENEIELQRIGPVADSTKLPGSPMIAKFYHLLLCVIVCMGTAECENLKSLQLRIREYKYCC
jgi:hypothetical protein